MLPLRIEKRFNAEVLYDLTKERFAQEAITRGLEQVKNGDALQRFYDQYCATGDSKYLNGVLYYAERIGMGIAFCRLSGFTDYRNSSFEDCLQELSIKLLSQLQTQYNNGKREENIVHTVQCHYRTKAIDVARMLKRQKVNHPSVSLDEMNETDDGKAFDVFGKEDLTPWDDPDDFIRKDLYRTLYRMYLNTMLQYSGEPQKVLSLCYARVLFHLQIRYDPYDIERAAEKLAKHTLTQEKWIAAIQKAQTETKASSVKWARAKMSGKTIHALIDESECLLQRNYDPSLVWGNKIRSLLNVPSPYRSGALWGTIYYTDTFSEKDTTDWVQSIHNSIADSVCRQICDDPELDKLVMQYDSPLKRRMIKKMEKRRKNNAPDER